MADASSGPGVNVGVSIADGKEDWICCQTGGWPCDWDWQDGLGLGLCASISIAIQASVELEWGLMLDTIVNVSCEQVPDSPGLTCWVIQ